MKTQPTLVIAIAAVALGAVTADGGDWTRWRGPSGNGVSPEDDWDPRALNGPARVVWRAEVGQGHSTMAVRGNRLYTLGERDLKTGGEGVYEEVVYCLDAASGREVWRYAYRSAYRDYPGPGSTPVVHGDHLYVTSRSGKVFCFDAATGAVVWRRDLVAESLAREPGWGFCASPAVDGELVILNAARAGIALDRRTGKVVWASEDGAGGLATPMPFDHDGRRLAAILTRGTLNAVDIATGKVEWSYSWNSDADPTAYGGALHLIGGGRNRGSVLLELGSGEPKETWESESMAAVFQSCAILGGHAYGMARINRRHLLQCVDMRTGEEKWSHDVGEWGSLIAAGKQLIVIRGDGELVIVEATPEGYRETSSARVFQFKDQRSYPRTAFDTCWTAPVLANGRIYARSTLGQVVCVDVRG